MSQAMRRTTACLLLWLITSTAHGQSFVLREEIGREWKHECVTFPLTDGPAELTPDNASLIGPDGEIAWQVLSSGHIAFHADLAPYEVAEFQLRSSTPVSPVASDLAVTENPKSVRIENSFTGIELLRSPPTGQGPIAGIRLQSGKWIASSLLECEERVVEWKLDVADSGSVLVEIVVTAEFEGGGEWTSRYRLYDREPVVLVDEEYSVSGKANHRLLLNDGFTADELFYRLGKGSIGKNQTWKIQDGRVFTMEPWLRWWMEDRQGSTFSVFNRNDTDLLTVAARHAADWVDPSIPQSRRVSPKVEVTRDETGVHANFPIAHGRRKWMLGVFPRDESLEVLDDETAHFQSPLPYQHLVRHGHFPLDRVKDYVLRWSTHRTHPSLLVTTKDVSQFVDRTQAARDEWLQKAKTFTNHVATIADSRLDEVLPIYFATRDYVEAQALERVLIDWTLTRLDQAIRQQFDQNGIPYGCAPHHQRAISVAISLADAVIDSPRLKPQERGRIYARIAFLSYAISRPDYWSEERGFSANPNMSTTVHGYRTRAACFLAGHPHAVAWARESLDALRNQLRVWADENGGWLEAPHYAMVSYDEILAALVMARNAGINDWLNTEPRIKGVIRWLAKISSPPDSRIGGYRHHPAIGNSYIREPCGQYGIAAWLFRESDSAFSAEMQWMFLQQNEYGQPGIGGFYPAFVGYRAMLSDPELPAKAPSYESDLFPETGVVLRNHFPSDRETQLHMIHGKNHEHYDFDSGALLLWGKGRLLANDFGYYGRAPQEHHNLVSSPTLAELTMKVSAYSTSRHFDYVDGTKGGWRRQIIFVKGETQESPSYFVVNDTVDKVPSAVWRMWFTADDVAVSKNVARVIGTEDVDTDVFFLAPADGEFAVERLTLTAGSGMSPDWIWGPLATTQIGLISEPQQSGRWTAVLFPRLKSEKPPRFECLANGRGVKVTHHAGVDYVFLSSSAFSFSDSEVDFDGTAGMLLNRGGAKPLSGAYGESRIESIGGSSSSLP